MTDVLTVDQLTVTFDVDGDVVRAVDGASFTVGRGEVVAVVGESGSGKSMTAMTAMGIAPRGPAPPGASGSGTSRCSAPTSRCSARCAVAGCR